MASHAQAIALKPDYAGPPTSYGNENFNAQDEQYSKMVELSIDENISEEQRCHINFGLVKGKYVRI